MNEIRIESLNDYIVKWESQCQSYWNKVNDEVYCQHTLSKNTWHEQSDRAL